MTRTGIRSRNWKRSIAGFRDILIHQYRQILEARIVWRTAAKKTCPPEGGSHRVMLAALDDSEAGT